MSTSITGTVDVSPAGGAGPLVGSPGTGTYLSHGGYLSGQIGTADHSRPRMEPASGRAVRRSAGDPEPSQRYALKAHWAEALEHAKMMEEAASEGDVYLLASEGIHLTGKLSAMWRLRHLREDDWASIINFLQGATAQVEFESFTREQCTALRLIVESHLRPDTDADDVAAVLTLLDRAGFSPWRGISER